MVKKSIRQEAIALNKLGYKVIPTYDDKSPTCKTWKEYISKPQSEEEVIELFDERARKVAIVATDGIEMLDFDVKNYDDGDDGKTLIPRFAAYLKDVLGDEMLTKIIVQKTPSGGKHFIYKTNIAGNNQPLARNEKKRAFIETRGRGGYFLAAPSDGYVLQRNDWANIQTLTNDERNKLINAAKCFNEFSQESYTPEERRQLNDGSETSWTAYDLRGDALRELMDNGWRECTTHRSNEEWLYLTRPNAKTNGIDAAWHTRKRFFFVHSTSDNIFDGGKGYSPSAVYAHLSCNGDFALAARELLKLGFGSIEKQKQEIKPPSVIEKEHPDLIKRLLAKKFDYNKPTKEINACLSVNLINHEGKEKHYPVVGFGMLLGLVGEQKSGKTTTLTAIVAAALSGKEILNFSLKLENKKMLWFDTEQSEYFYEKQLKRPLDMAGIKNNSELLDSYPLRDCTPQERLLFIEYIIYNTPNVGVIVLDGLVDVCRNSNDIEMSQEVINRVMKWTHDSGALVITNLHLTKSSGFLRGHLGTELQNKADAIIQVSKDKASKVFTIKSRDARFREFDDFYFMRDEKSGDPYLVNENGDELDENPVISKDIVATKIGEGVLELQRPEKENWLDGFEKDKEDLPF